MLSSALAYISIEYVSAFVFVGNCVSANIRHLLTAAVSKRMMGVRWIGSLLSGGLDSSLIAAIVCKLSKQWNLDYRIQTFATGMPGSLDLAAARKVCLCTVFLNNSTNFVLQK